MSCSGRVYGVCIVYFLGSRQVHTLACQAQRVASIGVSAITYPNTPCYAYHIACVPHHVVAVYFGPRSEAVACYPLLTTYYRIPYGILILIMPAHNKGTST